MADDHESPKAVFRRVTSGLQPGQPIQTELVEVAQPTTTSPLCAAVGQTLKAYGAAARDLLAGQYARDRELAPPHLRVPCHIYVMCCPDGIVVRYDATEEPPKALCTDYKEPLQKAAPAFSERVIHVPDDPTIMFQIWTDHPSDLSQFKMVQQQNFQLSTPLSTRRRCCPQISNCRSRPRDHPASRPCTESCNFTLGGGWCRRIHRRGRCQAVKRSFSLMA